MTPRGETARWTTGVDMNGQPDLVFPFRSLFRVARLLREDLCGFKDGSTHVMAAIEIVESFQQHRRSDLQNSQRINKCDLQLRS